MNKAKEINHGEKLTIYSLVTLQNDDVKNALKGTGIYEILLIEQSLSCARSLINVLYEYYDKESGTFIFGPSRDVVIFFGLQDIYRITGLPIDGKPVYIEYNEEATTLTAEDYGELFGLELPPDRKQKLLELVTSINEFNAVRGSPNYQKKVDKVARKMALLVIDSLIFNARGDVHVSTSYASLLWHVGGIRRYAWGAAALANLHSSLFTLVDDKAYASLLGPVYALMIFAFLRIPGLAPICYKNLQAVNSSAFPIMPDFCSKVGLASMHEGKYKGPDISEKMRTYLSALTENDVDYRLYPPLDTTNKNQE